MALFKPFRGTRASLDAQELHDGYAYFCIDDGSFHIDFTDADGNLQRKQINAKDAETLCGMSLEQIQKSISWNNLIDKPFGEETREPLEFNGDKTGFDVIQSYVSDYEVGGHVRVSEQNVTKDDIIGGNATVFFSPSRQTISFSATDIKSGSEYGFKDENTFVYLYYGVPVCFSVNSSEMITIPDGTSWQGERTLTFDKGLYLYYSDEPDGTPIVYVEKVVFSEKVKKLDEQFIPDTIARVADVPAPQIQADWNQTDDTQVDYIKNKPAEVTDEEILAWLNEESIVTPMASASGEIYTTNNNEIYIL